jgi:hypothetical protein
LSGSMEAHRAGKVLQANPGDLLRIAPRVEPGPVPEPTSCRCR